jgi:hypothetical protein
MAGCVLIVLSAGTATRAAAPRDYRDMTAAELKAEARAIYRDDLPYAETIKALLAQVDAEWPGADRARRDHLGAQVLRSVVKAMRMLEGRARDPKAATAQEQGATVELSMALDHLDIGSARATFYERVHAAPAFSTSRSGYHDVVVDLWERYQQAGKPVPYTQLLGLNLAGNGPSNGQSPLDLGVGQMYEEVGANEAAAKWYAKLPAAALGPLKAADCYFAAGRREDAAGQYRRVLSAWGEWEKIKAKMSPWGYPWPLVTADLAQIKAHAETRLAEIAKGAK